MSKSTTETLVSCPKCGTANFTPRGLKAHKCDGINRSALVVVDPKDAEMGQQLTVQYERAIGGIREVLIFGAMMLKVRDIVSTRGNDRSRGGGRDTEGQGLKGWLANNAPKVNLSTAYRFMDLAEGLRDEFSLAKKTDLVHLLSAPVEKLAKPERAKREKIDAFVEGKSQRQLLFDFGIDTRAGKPKGGDTSEHRSGKRRTKAEKDADDAAEAAAELWPGLRDELSEEWFKKRLFEHLDDGPLCNFVDLLGQLYDQAKDLRDERGLKPAKFVTEGWK